MNSVPASYMSLYKSGDLKKRTKILEDTISSCRLCPRVCCVNRIKGETGICRSGFLPVVQCHTPHFGEEPVISGEHGSGTVFFGNCNLRCVYCQNFEISRNLTEETKKEITFEELALIFLKLQEKGCHNINLVSPAHFVPQIVKALLLAVPEGLNIPIVYNTNSYDSVETLKLLDGIIDMYLADIKYSSNEHALKYSGVSDYVAYSRNALKEMWRQAGRLKINRQGIAEKGLIIRHLILPKNIAGSYESLKFIAEEISPDVTISIMAQYYPADRAAEYPKINRVINEDEYEGVLEIIESLGMKNIYIQELGSHKNYQPRFNNIDKPFKV